MQVTFVCPACRATVNAPPSLEGESWPCPKCTADVERWPAPINPPAVRVLPPPVEQAVWYYAAAGARRGPVTGTQLKSLVESGVLRPNDLVWREGMPAWVEAATVPGLFPAPVGARAAPPPAPQPAAEPDDDDRPARREDRGVVHVNVRQVVEHIEEEPRPRRRRRRGFRCPYCDSPERPVIRRQVSEAGWVVFAVLLFTTLIFCFIGLLIQEDVRYCRDCRARL